MADLPEVLTTKESIPDITPAVEKVVADVANLKAGKVTGTVEPVSQEQHDIVEKDIEQNKEEIAKLKEDEVTHEEHADVLSQIKALQDAVSKAALVTNNLSTVAESAAANLKNLADEQAKRIQDTADVAAKKVTGEAGIAAEQVTTINQGRPVAPTTTTEEDITTANQRLLLLIGIITTAAIAFVIAVGNVGLSIYLGVIGHSDQFPDNLKTALIFVLGFYMKGTVSSMPIVPTFQSRAGGGYLAPGQSANVGEKGTERITAGKEGLTVTPHHGPPDGVQ